jgi:hypothetical protein
MAGAPRQCPDCGRKMARDNQGPRCSPCSTQRIRQPEGIIPCEQESSQSFGEKAIEVLDVARWLLWSATSPGPGWRSCGTEGLTRSSFQPHFGRSHGTIAGAFFARFINPGWYKAILGSRDHDHPSLENGQLLIDHLKRCPDSQLEAYLSRRGLSFFDAPILDPDYKSTGFHESDPGFNMGEKRLGKVFHFKLHSHLKGFSVIDAATLSTEGRAIIRVWSALIPDEILRECIHRAVCPDYIEYEGLDLRTSRSVEANHDDIPIGADTPETFSARLVRSVEGPGLPCIELEVATNVPACEGVVKYYNASAWQHWKAELWDGRPDLNRKRLPSREHLIRAWTLLSLTRYTDKRSLPEAMEAWNSIAPGLVIKSGPAAWRECQAVEAIEAKLRAYLAVPWIAE